jgi:streptomycin 6-kinase
VSALTHLSGHIDEWRLIPDGEPFETHSSWLCFVRRDGERALLKVFKPGSDEAPSARYFAAHHGHGTVRVLANDAQALLIERISPGTLLSTLSRSGRDDEATHIVCDTITTLQSRRAATTGWPGHQEHATQFEKRQAIAPLTRDIVSRAQSLFRELDATQEERVLLHGDLHHENILFDEARGWLAIDPKGEVGELAYELAAPLRNPLEDPNRSPTQMDRRVRIYCERLNLDRQRVLGWCFARNASAAMWYADHTPEPLREKTWAAATLIALQLLSGSTGT